MFDTTKAYSTFSVDHLAAARRFYGETLGLDVSDGSTGFLEIRLASGAAVFVYAKVNHTPASFTILNFPVADVDAAVDELAALGVATKIYSDDEIRTDAKGIMRGHDPDIAWFKDPAGNVIAVHSV